VPRKFKKVKDLRGEDPESQSYWDEILRRKGLSMSAGRNEKLSYVGDSSHLETVNDMHTTDTGRVVPKDGAE
jgi:hypothetical protein